MEENKPAGAPKEGVSVEEIEKFGKKYRFQLFFLIYFVIATLLHNTFFSGWSIYLAGLGGILGVWLPEKVCDFGSKMFGFIYKQEKMTQLVLAIVGAIVSFFVPPLIFLLLGLMGGSSIYCASRKAKGEG